MTSTAAITVDGLRKRYGDYEAVKDVSFQVAEGEIFALLGRNGAGKTTTVEMLAGFQFRTPARSGSSVSTRSATARRPADGPESCCRRPGSSTS
ncbi:ATP-binding cassette domain-containing protein [Spongiactinospora sp. TRM90649]|uniref:ATP-binding cassette domain-containing protein n=1 Tax=Spongiactinospora sp. TRM90649 TaxID=3031114 RepID=UPI0023F98A09|nr:ATP-binding cassette domain-containing protein [Spongiactinospora sp. TRM90649]MDF5755659.1 ATP-binding cassette domain-containing protein [Spongiactinospora sp. TRM90649]